MRVIAFSLAFLLALPSTALSAQVAVDKVQRAVDAMDTNRDGKLSPSEWEAAGRRERGFRMADADKDGEVTVAELRALLQKYGRDK